MKTSEFVMCVLGCTQRETEFIDQLCDNDFSDFGDWDDGVLDDFVTGRGCRLCNYLIQTLFDEIVAYGVQEGLDENLFDYEINSISSGLYYDHEQIWNQDDLYELIESKRNEEEEE